MKEGGATSPEPDDKQRGFFKRVGPDFPSEHQVIKPMKK